MSIEQLGSLGEFVAAIATIATLMFLALQIRESTKVTKAQITRELVDAPTEHPLLLATDADLTQIIRRGLTDFSELSGLEQTRFHQWFYPLIAHVEATWRMQRLGLMDDAPAKGWLDTLLGLLCTPGGSMYWKHFRHSGNPEFVTTIDTLIELRPVDAGDIFDGYPFLRYEDE